MAADGLSQKPPTTADIAEAKAKTNIHDFILAKINSFRVLPIFLDDPTPILADNYSGHFQKIAIYLTILRRPPEMDTKELNALRKKVLNPKFKTITFSIKIVRMC